MNSLSILSTFVKQRTYLIILVKQTTYLITLPDRSSASETSQKDETSRLLCDAASLKGLNSLSSLNSHISARGEELGHSATHPPKHAIGHELLDSFPPLL
jgi:hypothetical protein